MAIIVNAIICTYQRREAMTEWEKAQNGYLYDANYDKEIVEARKRCADLCYEFNNCRPLDINKQRELLNAIFGSIKENPVITALFTVTMDLISLLVRISIQITMSQY